MLDTGSLDYADITSNNLKIEISPAIKYVDWENLQTGGNNDQREQAYSVAGVPTNEWVVASIDEASNRMELRRFDLLEEDSIETYIISPTQGRWWDNGNRDALQLQIEGRSDDNTAFSHAYSLKQNKSGEHIGLQNTQNQVQAGGDGQTLNLLVINVSCAGLKVLLNGSTYTSVTELSCFDLAKDPIKIGARSISPHETEVSDSVIKSKRSVRHFEWLMFNRSLPDLDTKRIKRYLRCKYGYPWDDGSLLIGNWKDCREGFTPTPLPPLHAETCCYSNETGQARVATYVDYTLRTCNVTTDFIQTISTYPDGGKTIIVTGETAGETTSTTSCKPLTRIDRTTGTTFGKQFTNSIQQWGPYYYWSKTAKLVAAPCPPNLGLPDNVRSAGSAGGKNGGRTSTTIADFMGSHIMTSTIYMKPNFIRTEACNFAKDKKHTFRITSVSTSSRKGIRGTRHFASLSGINLIRRNDVIIEGSETTDGTTLVTDSIYRTHRLINPHTNFTLLAKKTKTKRFYSYWTFDTPINATYEAETSVFNTYTTKTTLYSATTIETAVVTSTGSARGTAAGAIIYTSKHSTKSATRWTTQSSSSTFPTTEESSTTTTSRWDVPAHGIGTDFTGAVDFVESETYFGELSLTDQTDRWTSVSTRRSTDFGEFTSTAECFVPFSKGHTNIYNLPIFTDKDADLLDYIGFYHEISKRSSTEASAYLQEWDDTYIQAWIKRNPNYTKELLPDDPRYPRAMAFIQAQLRYEDESKNNRQQAEPPATYFTTRVQRDGYGNPIKAPLGRRHLASSYFGQGYDGGNELNATQTGWYLTEKVAVHIARQDEAFREQAKFDNAYNGYNRHTNYMELMAQKNKNLRLNQKQGNSPDEFTRNILKKLLGQTSSIEVLHTTYTSVHPFYGDTRVGFTTESFLRTWEAMNSTNKARQNAVSTQKANSTSAVGFVRVEEGTKTSNRPVYRTEDRTYDPNTSNSKKWDNSVPEEVETVECDDLRSESATGSYREDPRDEAGNKVLTGTQRATASGYETGTSKQTSSTTQRKSVKSTETYTAKTQKTETRPRVTTYTTPAGATGTANTYTTLNVNATATLRTTNITTEKATVTRTKNGTWEESTSSSAEDVVSYENGC